MDTVALDMVRLDSAGPGNFFVHDRATNDLIGRVFQQPSGNWWGYFYLPNAHSVSGGAHDTRDDAVTAVWVYYSKRH